MGGCVARGVFGASLGFEVDVGDQAGICLTGGANMRSRIAPVGRGGRVLVVAEYVRA